MIGLRLAGALVLLAVLNGPTWAADPASNADPDWCAPSGPHIEGNLPTLLSEGQHSMLKPSWATISMHVRPGAVPVTDVRVVSEAGSDALARTWLPMVRQWVGCSTNRRETIYQVRFSFNVEGISAFPSKEGFSLRAFKEPRGAPELPANDWGGDLCPIIATVALHQPQAKNVVKQIEGKDRKAVRDWLETLVPDLDYMQPHPEGNRVEFECRVVDGKVVFYSR